MSYGGYVIILGEPQRIHRIREKIERDGRFTDALSAPDWQPSRFEIAFVSLDGETLYGACLARRGGRIATAKYHVAFSRFVALDDLPLNEVRRKLRGRYKDYFSSRSAGIGGRVPPRTWEQFVRVVGELRPEARRPLEDLDALRLASVTSFDSPSFATVAQEKDATALALEFGGLRRQVLDLGPPDATPAPFLRTLREARLREDAMVDHDSTVFSDWAIVKKYQVGAVEFSDGQRRMTVINVNRRPIERTLGVDLLYYSHTYGSFVLVQYKRLVPQGRKSTYRPKGDGSYEPEIARMKRFLRKHPPSLRCGGRNDFRLHAGPFYFKLCDTITYTPLDTSLIKGMYLPLDLWLLVVDELGREHGSVALSYESVGRYVTNTAFIQLVRDGWIGSRLETTTVLERLIADLLKSGRSVILADSRKSTTTGRRAIDDAFSFDE